MSEAGSAGPSSAPDDPWWTDQPPGPPDEGSTSAGQGTSGGDGRRTWAIAGAVVLVIAAAAGGAVLANRSSGSTKVGATASGTSVNGTGTGTGQFGRRRPGTQGTITAISGSTLTVTTTAKAAVKVATTSSTTITDTTKGSLSDLKPGDHVRVTGTAGSSGAITARLVVDSRGIADTFGPGGAGLRRRNVAPGAGEAPPGGFPGGTPPNGQGFPGGRGSMTVGTVVARNRTTIVVKTTDGKSVGVATDLTTTVRLTTRIALTNLAKGDTVTVTGATANGVLTATAIRRGDEGFGFGGAGGPGGAGAFGPPSTTAP